MALGTKTMMRVFAALALILSGLVPATAQEFEKNILTGGPTGTYIQIGNDIAGLMSQCGQTLQVQESAGSLENFLGVRKRRATQFGIVQSDVLEYLKTFAADDPDIARAVFGVRIAFPLYNEEVHILAKRDISSLAELSGKRVAVGVEDSGTFLTASLVLDIASVNVGERVAVGPDDAMAQLNAGQIDAMFYVAGAPTKLFADTAIDASRFHILPLADPVLQSVYTPAVLPAGTYPFQQEAVDLVAVKAVLMTYEYDPGRNAYHRNSCQAVSDVSNLILTRFAELQGNGHPKWKQVDLNDIPPGWDVGTCVNAGLSVDFVSSCSPLVPANSPEASSNESQANNAYRQRICAAIGC